MVTYSRGISGRGSQPPVIEPGEEVIEGAAGEISPEES
jgi:hypothetical protein